ncbi:transglutaminase [candidate division GN15 bacterium]|nr:transglutaminase [candidate division GN15 bacterium]
MRTMVKTMLLAALVCSLAVPALMAQDAEPNSIPAPFRCPQGLAFDGQYLWNADRHSDMLYKVDPTDGDVLDSLPTPGYVPRGLAWDGTRVWSVDAEEQLIYATNPSTGIVETTIYCPVSRPTGLAWNGRYLWLAEDRGETLHLISSEDGTTIKSIPSPTRNAWGLTFDGTYLWVSDRYTDKIYMVWPENGDVVNIFDAPGPHSCGLAWDGATLWNVDYQTDRIYPIVIDHDKKYSRSDKKVQQVEFIHQTRNFGPGTVTGLDVYLAIPKDLTNQELLDPATFEPEATEVLTDKWGQQVAHFRFENLAPTEFATVRMLASANMHQTRYFVYPDRLGSLDDIPNDIRDRYLVNDAKFSMDDPVIQNGVREAVGDETNPYWIGRKIFNYIIARMEYELAGGWNVAPAVLERGNGSCSEYSFVYIAMCRAAGLPARYAGSIVVRGDDASYDEVFHRWVEIYLPGYGWFPVDPSRGDKKWPADQAKAFGSLSNGVLITTVGGGGSEYLEWGYNANERWQSRGKCKVVVENFGEWTPVAISAE